jgi:hypothetical protein
MTWALWDGLMNIAWSRLKPSNAILPPLSTYSREGGLRQDPGAGPEFGAVS